MIVYQFSQKNFLAAAGYARIQVVEGQLKLADEPDEATLALIEQYGGARVELEAIPAEEETPSRPKRKNKEVAGHGSNSS